MKFGRTSENVNLLNEKPGNDLITSNISYGKSLCDMLFVAVQRFRVQRFRVQGFRVRGSEVQGFKGLEVWDSSFSAAAGQKNGQSNRKRDFGIAGSHTNIKSEYPPAMHSALSWCNH